VKLAEKLWPEVSGFSPSQHMVPCLITCLSADFLAANEKNFVFDVGAFSADVFQSAMCACYNENLSTNEKIN
jgi:hypothetical protein